MNNSFSDNFKGDLKDFLDSISDYQIAIQRIFLLLILMIFIVSLVFWKSFLVMSAIVALVAGLYGGFSFCLVAEPKATKQFNICCWTLLLCVCSLINGTLISSFEKFPKLIMVLLDIMAIVAFFVFKISGDEDTKEIKKQKIREIITKDIYSNLGLGEKDTYMGKFLDTGEYNVVPYKDRFLHTLVLGVTGCGKTSQSLLPMVAHDVQCPELGVVCLDPKGDFAEQVYALAKINNRNDVVYFNPTLANCPYFNPLIGDIDSVSECLVTTFKKLENEQQTFFANMDEMLMRRCIKVVKRVKGDSATLDDISTLMSDANGGGKEMLNKLSELPGNDVELKENRELISWFLNDYYTEISPEKGKNSTKTYEQCSGVRNQVSKLLANSLIKKILCPDKTIDEMEPGEYLDFDGILEKGGVLAMSSAQGDLRELGTFIGFFLILSFESAVFRRPGDENTRRGVIFYVDEFQKYANEGYNDLLTMGRSYRVASVLATQTREGIKANSSPSEGQTLLETVSSNCRNKIIYPGCSYNDASYYSKEFGEYKRVKERRSYSKKRGAFSSIDMGSQSESISSEEKMTPMFYPVEIQQRTFGEAVTQVVRNNTVQKPCAVKLEFIPKELKNKVDSFIEAEIRPQHLSYRIDDLDGGTSLNRTSNYTVSNPMASEVVDTSEVREQEDPTKGGEGDHSDEFDF